MTNRSYGFKKSPDYDKIQEIVKSDKEISSLPKTYYLNKTGPILNQGTKNICVPCSLLSAINYHYALQKKDVNLNTDYIWNKRSNKPDDTGMFISDAMKILKDENYIKMCGKLTSIGSIKASIFLDGPIIVGLPVKSFDNTFWRGTKNYGGHAVALIGYTNDSFIIKNSWGTGYGLGGEEEISFSDLNSVAYEIWTIVL